MERVGGDDFFEFATNFDPDFRRIAHMFFNFPFWLAGWNHSLSEKKAQAEFLFL
jgi:hypothetical protein